VCSRIAKAVNLTDRETCIEIGGGKGALTRNLAGKPRRLIVYEIDPKWAIHLREYGPQWDEKIEVREKDALRIEWTRDALQIPHGEPIVVTGNLPYYITSPLLLRIAYSGLDFDRAVFLIQKEVAEKIVSKPGDSDYGRLNVSLGAFLKSEILFDVEAEAFKPPPKVTSTLIRLVPHPKPLIERELVNAFEKTVQVAFHMRRKMLKNNLHAGYPDIPTESIMSIFGKLGIDPKARAQELSVQDFINLIKELN
jgi:16S rRNA (adenine1518-N6/adenine1519-N6)-dimethyltransferase